MMDIFEVGTGGGSIARVEHGALRVGPQSAGASPGPACYGARRHASRPSPTPTSCSAGSAPTASSAARCRSTSRPPSARSRTIAKPLGLDVTAAADGILRIAATAMSYAVKGVTTERGLDAGDFALVAYGGAGPLQAVQVAREIGIRKVIIPLAPGVFSAFGMLFSDLRYDFVRTALMRLDEAPFERIEKIYRELEEQGRDGDRRHLGASRRRSWSSAPPTCATTGQEHAVTVDLPDSVFKRRDREAIKRLFDEMHELRYGTSAPQENAEIVSLRATVTGLMRKPTPAKIKRGTAAPPKAAFTGKRACLFRRQLPAGADLCARRAAGRQPDQGAGADRGACLDHGADAGRRLRGRCLRQLVIAVGRAR